MWHTGAGRRKGLSFGVSLGLGKMKAQGRFRRGHRLVSRDLTAGLG